MLRFLRAPYSILAICVLIEKFPIQKIITEFVINVNFVWLDKMLPIHILLQIKDYFFYILYINWHTSHILLRYKLRYLCYREYFFYLIDNLNEPVFVYM